MMPNIANDIYTITARPDRAEETLLGIRRTLQTAHSAEDFPKDLIETRLQADRLDVNIQATLKNDIRKISHIIPNYINAEGSFIRGDALNYMEPRGIHLTSALSNKTDFYYVAGNTLNIHIRKPTPYFEIGYWKYPDLSIEAINADWIVLGYPQVITAGAVGAVYRALGDMQNANAYQVEFYSLLERLKSDVLYLGDAADLSTIYSIDSDWGGQG